MVAELRLELRRGVERVAVAGADTQRSQPSGELSDLLVELGVRRRLPHEPDGGAARLRRHRLVEQVHQGVGAGVRVRVRP